MNRDLYRDIHQNLGLRKVINARGSYTPFGVSRSSDLVAEAVGESLKHYFIMDELAAAAGQRIAAHYRVDDVAFAHCAAGALTMAVAAIMVGDDMDRLYGLPASSGINNRVVIQAGHLVNYGQPLEQAVRLAGAQVIVAGSEAGCSPGELDAALANDGVCALVCVESRLCKPGTVAAPAAVSTAHNRQIAVLLDGAAQDLRLPDLLSFGADITIVSGQKYFAGPTCGLALGRADLVRAMRLQERGIGRAMKPSKEGIIGALAAVEMRANLDMMAWTEEQQNKSMAFAAQLKQIRHLTATCVLDPTGLPFSRVRAVLDEKAARTTATDLVDALAQGDPMIAVQEHELALAALNFELVGLRADELAVLWQRLTTLLGP